VRTHFDHHARPKTQRLAELERKTAELERKLSDARESLDRELTHYAHSWDAAPEEGGDTLFEPADDNGYGYPDEDASFLDAAPVDLDGARADLDAAPVDLEAARVDLDAAPVPMEGDDGPSGDHLYSPEARTAILINRGRPSATPRRVPRGVKMGAAVIFTLVLIVLLIAIMLPGPGPAWPASVARVQAEIGQACQNPDISSEPDQVNFACGKSTRQILWVFALLTSGNNPTWAEAGTGRQGLEPITPQQGGVVAWSLNLHHPYNPADPIDSLQVAARAINNIVGGATVTGTYGRPVIQQGLEGHAANCLRYTGSAKVTSHKGFPGLCARPVSSPAGQAALVADIYQRWVPGAGPKAAQNAATLFANAKNPASPQVQAILKQLPNPVR
jgi:hypothetical protein